MLGNYPSLLIFLSFQITYELCKLLWLVSFNLLLLKQYYHNLKSYRRTNLDLWVDKIFLWTNFRRLSRPCLEEGKYDNSFTVIRKVNICPISCSTCYQGNIAYHFCAMSLNDSFSICIRTFDYQCLVGKLFFQTYFKLFKKKPKQYWNIH